MSSDFKCLVCGQGFQWRKSLHAHLKKHDLPIETYYTRFYKRMSLYSGKPIPFKNVDDYLSRDFVDKREMNAWLKGADKKTARQYVVDLIRNRVQLKDGKFAPSCVDLGTLSCFPSMAVCENLGGSYKKLCEEIGVEPLFPERAKEDWFCFDDGSIRIGIDTREQKPFVFLNSRATKLEVGDYTALGDAFSFVFIDRKSPSDFCSTLSRNNLERFENEIKRAKELGAILFVVIESSAADLKNNWKINMYCQNLEFVFHNMRLLEHKYPRAVQFVFCSDRAQAQDVSFSILKMGEKCALMDIQYEMIRWLGK
jgi:hypothetical protein